MNPQGDDVAIIVQGANVHLGESLPVHARQGIARVASKYFGRLNAASVHFRRDGIVYHCTVIMQMGGLDRKSAEASDKNIYAAFNAALERVAKQLRRTKRELREDQPIRTERTSPFTCVLSWRRRDEWRRTCP